MVNNVKMTVKEIANIETLLIRHYDKELSAEQAMMLDRWIESSPDNKKTAEEIYRLCYMIDVAKTGSGAENAYRQIRGKIRSRKREGLFRWVRNIAATLAIPLLCTSIYMFSNIDRENGATIELTSTTGMISSVTLPDSSRVWLNSNSTLRYPAKFRGKECRVELSGEAYFDVAKNKSRKFIVAAKDIEVEVYGTRFNVEAYNDDHMIRTTLVEGSVGLKYEAPGGQRPTVRMVPGQIVSYDKRTGSLHLDPGDAAVNSSWKNGKIILRDTPLEDALRIIGNKYNVSFSILDRRLLDNTYMGTFTNQGLDVIIKYFSMSSQIHFREVPTGQNNEISGRRVIEVY